MISRLVTIVVIISVIFYIEAIEEKTCGKRFVHHNALITNGFLSNEGDWPWHAALYHISHSIFSYKCGGTLLTTNTILTAAHCVFENNIPISPDRVLVYLGRHNLRVSGTNSQTSQVFLIIPHPNYNPSDQNNDIAILRLSTEATFNSYVQPICLWDSNKLDLADVVGKLGTVIGWGITETDQLSHILRQAFMPVVPSLTCLTTNRDFFGAHLSETNFCAGFRNGTTVCNGDSGGSMTFVENGVYYIRGIVSVSVSRGGGNYALCDPKHYVIFTDVAKYLSWIENTVPQLKSAESKLDLTDKVSIIDTQECGLSKDETDSDSEEEKWPWLVPLFTKLGDKFLCRSNIINNQFLLSVAHCFQNKGAITPTPASTIYAYLGGYDLKSLNENFTLKSDIKTILIHPDWNSNVATYDGDIALLRTKNVIAFTDYIQPICLPTADSVISNVRGIVISSGRSEDVSSNETLSKKIEVKSVNEDVCRSNPALVSFASPRMFCVDKQERIPCKDDIGSGFYVKNAAGTYGITGLVSTADCQRNKFALFTSVPNFIPWIFTSLNYDDNGGDNGDASDWKCLKINCMFGWNDADKRYECVERSFHSVADNIKICSVEGSLMDGKSYPDVNTVIIRNSSRTTYIPDMTALRNKLPNFNELFITSSGLLHVERSKLGKLPQLRILNLDNNEIEILNEDILYDLPNVEILSFVKNRIKILPENLLGRQPLLKELWASDNEIETISENFFKNNKKLTHIYLDGNMLNSIVYHFNGLPQLSVLDLRENKCIDKQTCGGCATSLSEIQKIITRDCDCKKRVSCSTIEIDRERNGISCNVDLVIKFSDQNCVIIFDEFPKSNVTGLIIWGELEALPDLSDAYRIFKNIKYLGFGLIKIKEVKRNKLTPLRKVSWLNFWGNEISALDADTFDDLLEIDKLVLADNRLKVLHRDLFKELRKVTEIYLQKNQVEVLPEGLFRNNRELKNIYVGENNLRTIATDFRNLPKLVAIEFSGNQCINEWCLLATFCGTSSKTEMQTKIWNKCNIPRNR